MNLLEWTVTKPEFKEECLVISAVLIRGEWEYETYIIKMVGSDEGWYLGWLNGRGEEYGSLEDFSADKYFVMPLLKQLNV